MNLLQKIYKPESNLDLALYKSKYSIYLIEVGRFSDPLLIPQSALINHDHNDSETRKRQLVGAVLLLGDLDRQPFVRRLVWSPNDSHPAVCHHLLHHRLHRGSSR